MSHYYLSKSLGRQFPPICNRNSKARIIKPTDAIVTASPLPALRVGRDSKVLQEREMSSPSNTNM